MRILEVCPDFPPWAGSGAGETFRLLAEAWHQMGHEVTVVCSRPASQSGKGALDVPYPIQVYQLLNLPAGLHEADYYAPMRPGERQRFLHFVQRESTNYDLVFVHGFLETIPRMFLLHYPRPAVHKMLSVQYGVAAAQFSRVFAAGSWLMYQSIGRLLVSRTEHIVVFSSEANSELREYFGTLKGTKVFELTLGIDSASFANEYTAFQERLPAAQAWLESRSIHSPFVFAIGRNHRAKGFDLLLESFGQLTKEFPSLSMVLAGERTPFTRELEHMIRSRGLQDKVVILGRVSSWERMALLATSTVFVIPSRKEGFGLNAVHARILSKPTVATLTGAHAQILGTEGPYWLVEPGDVPRMTEALHAALRRGPASVLRSPVSSSTRSARGDSKTRW